MFKVLFGFILGILASAGALLAAAFAGVFPVAATDTPPAIEVKLARGALKASLEKAAAPLHNPITADDATLLAGMKIYRDNCAGCHGEPGKPSEWGSTSFFPRVPQLADVRSNLSDEEMFFAVKQGIRYSGMGGWQKLMSDDDIWKVVTFAARMHQLPPAVAEAWKAK